MDLSKQIKLAVFASGRGSNAKNIFEHARSLSNVDICALITDKQDAGVLEYGKQYDIPSYTIPVINGKKDQEKQIIQTLEKYQPDYLCLCGYMRILSADFINHFSIEGSRHSQIINIHPSLLPEFPGKDGYGDAFRAGAKQSGVTLHFVDEGVDTGPIIKQAQFERYAEDDLETFKARGLVLEHEIYRELLTEINDNGEVVL